MTIQQNPEIELQSLIADSSVPPQRISDLLDALSADARVAAIRSFSRGTQIKLWHKVDGFREVTLEHFVPKSTPLLTPVRHPGRNTMPAFKLFEKRFYRMGDGSQMAGANFQPISPITGPGYFVATEDTAKREVLVDYRQVPTEAPTGWPKIVRNEVGISRFIYGFLVDRMRRVSEHVTIGRANRHGKDFGAWFMLCREDRA